MGAERGGHGMPMMLDEIERALKTLIEPGSIAELRVPCSSRGTRSGYFSDFSNLARNAAMLSGTAPGVYITLNPVRQELLARGVNRVTDYAKHTTADSDIVCRRWLLIDFDPIRPAGISSTETEHCAALHQARECREWLLKQGWPEPVLADSGNGAHLLCRVDLPNTVQARELIKNCLEVLALQFDDELTSVDLTTYNAARICKIYGTQTAKGDSTPDRPHRVARLLEIPAEIRAVKTELLQSLAAQVPKPVDDRWANEPFDLAGWVAEHSLPITAQSEWKGGSKWIINPCPWNPEHNNRSAYIVQFSNGAIAAGCHHDSCSANDWKALRDLLEPGWRNRNDQSPASHYRSTPSGLLWFKDTKDGRCPIPLTNFEARIVSDIRHDDGGEIRRTFEIEATLHGQTSLFTAPAAQFHGMNWAVEHLGAGAVVLPGFGTRDHARAAIQLLSGDVPCRTIFGHVGWRKIDDEWAYLHGGGAMGANGNLERVEVALPDALQSLVLPDPPEGQQLIDAWRSSLFLLDVATDTVSVGLFLAIWRSVIASSDFTVHLAGPTGVFKTELSALAMQHFGAGFDARHLPASWSSTGNSLEGLAFIAKDALLVIDDFAPTGSTADIQRYHKEADRVLRAQRNNAGRHRMRADATLKASKPPRGLILSTGEDVPRGQSLRAGMLVLEIGPNDVDQQLLTRAQADAVHGIYAQLMAGFLKWLAPRYEPLRERLRSRLTNLRLTATGSTSHRRTPEIVANLGVGLEYFLDFGLEIGAITEVEATRIRQRCWAALGNAVEAQTAHLWGNDPAQRFLELLGAAIASGRAHVAGPDGYEPAIPQSWGWREFGKANERLPEYRPQGDRVGWVEGPNLFLDLDSAFAAAQTMGHELGDNIAVTSRTLSKRLHEKGLLVKTSTDSRQTFKVRNTLEGRRREVVHLAADVLGSYTCAGTDQDEGTTHERNAEPTSPAGAQSADIVPTRNPTVLTSVDGLDSADLVGLVGFDAGRKTRERPGAGFAACSAVKEEEGIQSLNTTKNPTTAENAEEISGEEII